MKEKELFKNETKYTEKVYDLFLESYRKEYTLSNNLYTLFYLIFLPFCLIYSIINKEIILAIAIFIILVIYIWYKFIRPNKKIQKEKESNKIQKEYTNTFKFYKQYFTVKNVEGFSTVFYFKIYKLIETKSFFYIYISRDYAFLVSKSGFADNKCEEFKKFIKKKTWTKYKNRCNLKNNSDRSK